jgi:hypothetical protein
MGHFETKQDESRGRISLVEKLKTKISNLAETRFTKKYASINKSSFFGKS